MERHVADNIEQRPTKHWMCKCPNLDESSKVVSMFQDGKFLDRLHPEFIKRRGKRLVEPLYTIIKDTWENLEVPTHWKDA